MLARDQLVDFTVVVFAGAPRRRRLPFNTATNRH